MDAGTSQTNGDATNDDYVLQNDEILRRLIQAVKPHRLLWDRKEPAHYKRKTHIPVWEEIGRQIGVSGDSAKNKWQYLRSTVIRQLTRENVEPKMRYHRFYNDIKFVWKDKPISNDKPQRPIPIAPLKSLQNGSAKAPGVSNKTECATTSTTMAKTTTTTPKEPSGKRRKESDVDADYLFLMSLLPGMKKLSEMSKMQLKLKMQHIILTDLAALSNGDL